MKQFRRLISSVLALAMVFSLCACGGGDSYTTPAVSYESNVTVSNDASLDLEGGSSEASYDGAVEMAETEETEEAESTAASADASSWDYQDCAGSYWNEAAGDGFVLYDDGTFKAYRDYENRSGKAIGIYYQDGDEWVFESAGIEDGRAAGTFDGVKWTIRSEEYVRPAGVSPVEFNTAGMFEICINGSGESIIGKQAGSLEDDGLKIDSGDLNAMVEPGESVELQISHGRAKAAVQVINTFENAAPVSSCKVSSFYTEDTTGTFQLDYSGSCCGQDNFDDLLTFSVYDYQPDRLVYKTYIIPAMYFTTGSSYGAEIINITGDVTLTMTFDGATLTSFRYEADGVSDHAMDSNLQAGDLEEADEEAIAEAEAVRDDILTRLQEAFADTDITLNIDETTGEITMDNSILFDTDSYTLSDEGKAYIDRFFSIYAQILLSDEFYGKVAEIRFEGHTDSTGSFAHNQKLSEKRAEAVLDYCLNSTDNGLTDEQRERLKALAASQGYADTDPVRDESGAEDAAASRRVAVRFFVSIG